MDAPRLYGETVALRAMTEVDVSRVAEISSRPESRPTEESDPEYRHAGIDLFLDPLFHGRGLGQDVVRTVAWYLLETRGHHRLVIDSVAANTRAIRCYEAVGFRPVGLTRSSWWDHVERRWADGVLLDLLRSDLR